MVNAIVSVNGRILPVDIRRGKAVYSGTRLPVLDDSKIKTQIEREKVNGLVEEATKAQLRETELQNYWRVCEERANQEPLDIREGILKLIQQGSKWEFSELLEETNLPIEALWRDEDSNGLFVQPPEESLLAKKLTEGNYNFTLTEAKQLVKLNPEQYPTELIVALGELSSDFTVSSLHKKFTSIILTSDEENILAEFEKIPHSFQVQLLRTNSFSLIWQSVNNGLPKVSKAFLEALSERDRAVVLSSQSYRMIKQAVSIGDADTIKTLLELLAPKDRSLALRYNHAKFLRMACQQGRKDLVKLILDIANEIDGKLPKTMIKSKNHESCQIAVKVGRPEILSCFKKYINIPNRIIKKPWIPVPLYQSLTTSQKTKGKVVEELSLKQIELKINNPHKDLNLESAKRYFPAMQMVDSLEKTGDACINAYKLALLFPSEEEGVKWLTKRINRQFQDSYQPVHDAMLFTIPKGEDWNPGDWSILLKRLGDEVLNYLPLAPKIENAYQKIGGKAATGLDFCKLNINDLISLSSQISYIGADVNRNFAIFCDSIKPKITQEGFDKGIKALDYLRSNPGVVDNDQIPEIGIIDGADFGYPDFYMRKLSKASEFDLMVSLVIGRFVRCCNHLDGATSQMALAQTTSENGGVYALYKKEDGKISSKSLPVGKTTVWRGKDSITFNSWEYPDMQTEFKDMGKNFLLEAAARAISMDETIEDVTLGGKNPGITSKGKVNKMPIDPKTKSIDSDTQILVAERKELKKKQIAQLQQKVVKSLESIPEEEISIIPIRFLSMEKNFPVVLAS